MTDTTPTTITFVDSPETVATGFAQDSEPKTPGSHRDARLYGVGVGPGASDLLTLRALRVMEEVDVLAIPRPSDFGRSVAWSIVEPHVGNPAWDLKREARGQEPQERLFLTFPMSKDPDVLIPAWTHASQEIGSRLAAGKSVAFLTQGDPYVYSTFIYLEERIKEALPTLTVEVVPGVTSLSAVPIAAGIPLADGQERVAVIPATYGLEELRTVLRSFDAILIMKVSSMIRQVIALLEEEGLADKATYVERASSQDERVIRDIKEMTQDRCVYFSMVFVHKKNRSGILAGRQAREHGAQKTALHGGDHEVGPGSLAPRDLFPTPPSSATASSSISVDRSSP